MQIPQNRVPLPMSCNEQCARFLFYSSSASRGHSTRNGEILCCDWLENLKLSAADGFRKSKSFLVLNMSDGTLQSIPGVNSRIYCIDQNPTRYSAPLVLSIDDLFENHALCIPGGKCFHPRLHQGEQKYH